MIDIEIDIIYGMDIGCWLSIVVSAAKSTVVMMATIKKVKRMNIVIYFIQWTNLVWSSGSKAVMTKMNGQYSLLDLILYYKII